MKWDKEAAAADTQRRKRRRKDEITEIQKKKYVRACYRFLVGMDKN